MTNAISMVGLTKHYKDVQALTDLTLDVPAGTIFGFLGPNGAGKTTALKVLAGLARPTAGRATLNGIDISAAGDHRRELGYLSQDPRFYGWMTGRETLRYVARFHGIDGDTERRIDHLLERVGIAEAGNRRTSTYSGGMRQRLGIAQALVGRPAVILLDEPVSALDPIGRKDVLDLMRDLKGETTVFYSTHILDDVQRVSDHVAILDPGVTSSDGVTTTFDVSTLDGASINVQRSITGFAVSAGLTLISNTEETLDLETVFLRLIDQKEVAA